MDYSYHVYILSLLLAILGYIQCDCRHEDYVNTLKIGSGIGSVVSTAATIGACVPVAGTLAVVAGILSSSAKMTHVINVSTCLRNKVPSLPSECKVPMTSMAAATGTIQSATAGLEALSLLPFVGCFLIPPKLGLISTNAIAIDAYADQWKERGCHKYMPSGCSCDLF